MNIDKPTTEMLDDVPTVQIPLGADRAGLTVDGEFTPLYELPDDAREAYVKYAEQGGNVRIYQCDNCGYLSDSDAFSASSYGKTYECGNCSATLTASTQRSTTASYTQVHGPHIDPDDDPYVDVAGVYAEQNCPVFDDHGPTVDDVPRHGSADVGDQAHDCDLCVPNHPSHLGRLQNDVDGEITQSQMLETVAEAVAEFRDG